MIKSENVLKVIDVTLAFAFMFAVFILGKVALYGEQIKAWRMHNEHYLANEFVIKHLAIIALMAIIATVLFKVRDKITGEDKIDFSIYDKTVGY